MRLLACWVLLIHMVPECYSQTVKKDKDSWSEAKVNDHVSREIYLVKQKEIQAIRILEAETSAKARPRAVYFAIKYLGAIRSTKAIPILCDRLLFEMPEEYRDPDHLYALALCVRLRQP